jgi:hypothetical protein
MELAAVFERENSRDVNNQQNNFRGHAHSTGFIFAKTTAKACVHKRCEYGMFTEGCDVIRKIVISSNPMFLDG